MRTIYAKPEITKDKGKYTLRVHFYKLGDGIKIGDGIKLGNGIKLDETFKFDGIPDRKLAERLSVAFESFFHMCCAASQGKTLDEYLSTAPLAPDNTKAACQLPQRGL